MNSNGGVVRVVRLRAGVVGESQRVCHLVRIVDVERVPQSLVALCGVDIAAGTAELLAEVVGMPCGPCWAVAPLPADRTLGIEAGADGVPSVLERLASNIPIVANDIRSGRLARREIAEYGDLVYEVAVRLWHAGMPDAARWMIAGDVGGEWPPPGVA